MRVHLTLNIGTGDAARLSLSSTAAGSVLDVSPETAAELIRLGWATGLPDQRALRPAARTEIHAVPPVDLTTATPVKRGPGRPRKINITPRNTPPVGAGGDEPNQTDNSNRED